MKQTLQNLLAEGKTKQVIAELMQLSTDDTDLKAEIVQLSARYAEYERKKRMDLEDPLVLGIELNKINSALLSGIGQLEKDNTPNAKVVANNVNAHSPKQSFSWTKWTGLNDLKSWIAIFAGLAGILTFYFKIVKGDEKGKLINVTVQVEDKMKATTLRKQGYVTMLVKGGEPKKELIDDKDAASFKNVEVGDKVKLNVEFSEPYRPLKPDSLYTIPADGRITLAVGLQNLNRIFGTVLWRNEPLGNVLVVIGELRDTSDAVTGYYEIPIPEQAQRQKQEVKFLKTGYKMLIKNAFPQTNESLNVVMEK